MKIVVQGMSHLGLVTIAGLSELGNNIIAYSYNKDEISELKKFKLPILEPGLNKLIKKNLLKKKIYFTSETRDFKNCEILWYCLDSPINENDIADTKYIIDEILKTIKESKNFKYLFISSQIPLGTIKLIEKKISKIRRSLKISYIPENLRLGKALKVFLKPDRIIVGLEKNNKLQKKIIKKIFNRINKKIIFVSNPAAEMIKHSINGFLALSITYINEIANICTKYKINPKEIELGLKSESRIGTKSYLSPGNAFGGGTLARDVKFLNIISKKNYLRNNIISNILKSNNNTKNKIKSLFNKKKFKLNTKILILGLTYKEGTSSISRSESLNFLKWLIKKKYKNIFIHDPLIKTLKNLEHYFIEDYVEVAKSSDIILMFYKQNYYKNLFNIINKRKKIIYDPFCIW